MDLPYGDGGLPRRVAPFGYPRIAGCLLLPAAFRRLPRPSSALSAKASALCSFLLNLFLSRFITGAAPFPVRAFRPFREAAALTLKKQVF